ncbi:MAG: LPS assembly lipoprotein LptE [Pseudomonadota bacterium]
MRKIIGCITLTLLSSACDWHLRGAVDMPQDLSQLYISAVETRGTSTDKSITTFSTTELMTELRQQLKANRISVIDDSTAANYELIILEESMDKRTAGVGTDALSSAYEITLKSEYEIRTKNSALVVPATASSVRSFNYNTASLSSSAQEEMLLIKEMRRDLVQQMLRRLNAVVRHPEANNSEPGNGKTAP